MIEYRRLNGFPEFNQAVDLERRTWDFSDLDLMPPRLFLIAIKVGGQAIGAFDGDRLVGFCLAVPGIKPGARPYLHSDMLAVLPDYRNRGIGRQLKLEQRKDALSRSVRLIEWTFDPLELKNAFLNIERLGVIIRRYLPNLYGITSSRLHASMPTDRCVAEWRLDNPRTVAVIAGEQREREPVAETVEVPALTDQIRRENLDEALKIQKDVREKFQQLFERSLAVTGFERRPEAGVYLLSPWQ